MWKCRTYFPFKVRAKGQSQGLGLKLNFPLPFQVEAKYLCELTTYWALQGYNHDYNNGYFYCYHLHGLCLFFFREPMLFIWIFCRCRYVNILIECIHYNPTVRMFTQMHGQERLYYLQLPKTYNELRSAERKTYLFFLQDL